MQMFGSMRAWTMAATLLAAGWMAGCGSRTPLPPPPQPEAVQREGQAFVEALRPRRPGRPVVAVLALNDGTETTDLLLPHAVLEGSGLFDVQVVAGHPGTVQLFPALAVQAEQDLAGFDRAHPGGADYVIVPALARDDDPVLLAWLRRQAARGAIVIGVCRGTRVVGEAGLLDGRRYTGHWYDRSRMQRRHPAGTHVPHLRYVIDRGVATTTGITASVPAMLALVEAVGGHARARALADELGVPAWGPAHDSTPFRLTGVRAWNYLVNKAAFWRGERRAVDVRDGMDDVALALVADAWSRTGRMTVEAAAPTPTVRLRSGLQLVAHPAAAPWPRLPLPDGVRPLPLLGRTLCEIGARHGAMRQEWVMLEMEYPALEHGCGSA
ncbi:DJ-1/PfpI family protein [Caldimonas thermodepolymerans]|uniref:DJ-1/PfpI family protein n=1 Tax=Caldimonas thermodepolymerans TaxID=215580 RepID=UPI002235DD85|nr:DJ-1/PfpI family protein [Caldimonas thermodepolymerans]UZG44459.1 DJ-1/PfpI family protein [Caldimonas thermodepolymerans]